MRYIAILLFCLSAGCAHWAPVRYDWGNPYQARVPVTEPYQYKPTIISCSKDLYGGSFCTRH